jgi:hypothetical protein
MPHEYIAETTHGDIPFTTDVHHEHHHKGFEGWYDDHKSFIDGLVNALGVGAQLLGIHRGNRGQRAGQISKRKE